MKTRLLGLAVLVAAATSTQVHAQSCTSVINLMKEKSANGLKTTLTVMSHQANTLRAYSGTHVIVPGAPQYEAKLLFNGNWMTTATPGGVKGLMQFVDRFNTAIPPGQNFSVDPPQMETVDFYLGASSIWIFNHRWGNWTAIPNPRCENGVIWGFGDPIGNTNGAGRLALYTFSYAFSAN
jgi:hypothetical protein